MKYTDEEKLLIEAYEKGRMRTRKPTKQELTAIKKSAGNLTKIRKTGTDLKSK